MKDYKGLEVLDEAIENKRMMEDDDEYAQRLGSSNTTFLGKSMAERQNSRLNSYSTNRNR